jgi:SP family myo-inositol transporter-like MFS transporter 13
MKTMPASPTKLPPDLRRYNNLLLFVAGLGGLLYGVDVGIIGGALPYLEATSGLGAGQLSVIVAAVLLGGVFSTLFAGSIADLIGRRPLLTLSGVAFMASIPIIALSHGYAPLFLGRLLQGMSGGVIGVVVPLYLAECLGANNRGKGTGIFQWLLTLGIVAAALIGIYYSYRVAAVARAADPATLFAFKDQAWRRIFWVSLPPGALFVLGTLFVSESPRWLFRKGRTADALAALRRSRTPEGADIELGEMREIEAAAQGKTRAGTAGGSLLQRKYLLPFFLACLILAFNAATGVNAIIGYNTNILLQSGLRDVYAHWGYVVFTLVNFFLTLVGVSLVDRKGRRFLFILGIGGLLAALLVVGSLFLRTERFSRDTRAAVQQMVSPDGRLTLRFDQPMAARLLQASGYDGAIDSGRASLSVIYSCGDYSEATTIVRSDDGGALPISVSRESCLPANAVEAFFKNPFGNLARSRSAPLLIQRALIGAVPSATNGWLVALGLYVYMGFYALGPGVCVWLALSELMPTRIRSNGMSVALVLNQAVGSALQAVFLPLVSKHGYSSLFFLLACFMLGYFLVVTFFLPETKGKTLEEIEEHFERGSERLQRA